MVFKLDWLRNGKAKAEIYVEREKGNSLLLMEPVKPGAYQRALEKRGPGVHHLAIDVKNLDEFLISLSSTGWLLHPMSIRTMRKTKTAYLARPGFPALIEVQERAELKIRPNFVDKIGLRFSTDLSRLASAIGLEHMICREAKEPWLSCAGKTISLETLSMGETI